MKNSQTANGYWLKAKSYNNVAHEISVQRI
jgi:hypothetical protein